MHCVDMISVIKMTREMKILQVGLIQPRPFDQFVKVTDSLGASDQRSRWQVHAASRPAQHGF